MSASPDHCLACLHHRVLHAPIGGDAKPGDKCRVCQCAGLELQQQDNSADERAETEQSNG